ncbi:MAG TPA: alpha/beta hydrolase [Anaerolineales bacterium]|nr:alpha/beta hydrolase [Anaerolineales bacterium]
MAANMKESSLQENILERKGCRLHYWAGGAESRPLVVFTHGAGVDHRSFDLQVKVAAQKYRVLTWDVRGHGLSQPVGEPFTIPLAVEDLLAILEKLGCKKATFVGHSNGTYISQELAYRHPEMVQALVIADGTCITWPRSGFDRWILRSSNGIMNLLPFETLKKFGLPYFSARKDVQEYIYEAFSMLTKPTFIAIWNGVTSCLHDEPDYKITQPMLLVHGDKDQTGDIRKIAPLWAAATPNCQYEVIPNALHLAPMDNPEFFNLLLMDFLAKWAK